MSVCLSVCGTDLVTKIASQLCKMQSQKFTGVVEIKMKSEFEDGCGLSKGAGSRGVGSHKPKYWTHNILTR